MVNKQIIKQRRNEKKEQESLKPHIFYIVFRSRKNPLRMLVQKLRASKQMEIIFEESHFN